MPAFKRGKKSRPSSAAETSSTPSQGTRETGEPLERFKSTGISNLYSVSKPFKSAEYKSNRRWKNLKQVIAQEQQQQLGERLPVDFPVYWNIDAPPSLKPQKKYCDITGLPAEYTDPKTNIRYHSAEVYQIVRTLPPGTEQEYLALRNASVTLK
ncbi:chromatin-remodeling complex subunit ies6 [Coemansia sp. RSA 1285]|nr:chromatin-remodeling complex subunit ies6 [Coemansia sp. RSA 1804]KAJ2687470.1 chromatin-remodeling complex subunit ies6 [Coemansia sp. RSA 1285]